jgi:hypothetical protein
MPRLTDACVAKLKLKSAQRVFDDKLAGFGVRGRKDGRLSWIVQRKLRGSTITMAIADTALMREKEARAKAMTLLAAIARGEDPRTEALRAPDKGLEPQIGCPALPGIPGSMAHQGSARAAPGQQRSRTAPRGPRLSPLPPSTPATPPAGSQSARAVAAGPRARAFDGRPRKMKLKPSRPFHIHATGSNPLDRHSCDFSRKPAWGVCGRAAAVGETFRDRRVGDVGSVAVPI